MLAIVIPYYKRTFFEETLQSLAKQTDKRFVVYVGDDTNNQLMAFGCVGAVLKSIFITILMFSIGNE